jgi:hypothetical protein
MLSREDVRIIKSKEGLQGNKILIWVKDINTLNEILWQLNAYTDLGVRLVKTKLYNTFCEKLKGFVFGK